MGEKNDGLGLGLGLGCGANQYYSFSFHSNLIQNPSEAKHNHRQHRIFGILGFSGTFSHLGFLLFVFPSRSQCYRFLYLHLSHSRSKRDLVSIIRVRNRRELGAAVADFEDENGVSSPNSTVSSLSGKRNERETIGDENEAERTSCSLGGSDDDDGNGGGDMSKKKLRLTKEQSLLQMKEG